jgi:hypothetical protein
LINKVVSARVFSDSGMTGVSMLVYVYVQALLPARS